MCRFIESIRIEDGEIFLLDYHQKRVNQTFDFHKIAVPLDLNFILKDIEIPELGLFKLRIIYDLKRNFSVEIQEYSKRQISHFQLVELNNINYQFKYENREIFNNLKKDIEAEIIIVKNNLITDTSFSNLIFQNAEGWFTPESFLLNGVQRQFLLRENLISKRKICVNDLSLFTHLQIINVMNPMDETRKIPIERIIKALDQKILFY